MATCAADGGEQAAEKRDNDGTGKRVQDDSRVETNFFDARQARGQGAEDAGSGVRCQETQDGAEEREEEGFGEELRYKRSARSAHGKADRDFVLSLRGASQEQCNDVGAGDQEEQRDGAEEQPERAPGACDGGFFELVDAYREVRICFGELLSELVLYGGEVGTGLIDRNAWLEASPITLYHVDSRLWA
jgi:hypothetical protein